MPNLREIYVYRMTHIDNIPHILRNGITHADSPNRNPDYRTIGDSTLIKARNDKKLPDGSLIGNYIPFYFGVRMPMLYTIQNGYNGVLMTPPEKIVYCVCSVQSIIETGVDFIFADGHASAGLTKVYQAKDIGNIHTLLDFRAIEAKYWKSETDTDLKRRKEAEFLVLGDVPATAVSRFIVYNQHAGTTLRDFGIEHTLIDVQPESYF